MGLIFMDGFDHYTSAEIDQKWSTGGAQIVPGRTGMAVNNFSGGFGGTGYLYRNFYVNYTDLFFGCAMQYYVLSNSPAVYTTNQSTIGFFSDGNPSFTISVNGVGAMVILQNGSNNATVVASSDNALITAGVYYYFELKVHCNTYTNGVSNQDGVLTGRINGVQVFEQTGLTTPAYVNGIGFPVNDYYGNPAIVDDLYVADTSGEYNNDFIGDVRVVTLPVVGNGRINQWNKAGTPTNWQCVAGLPGALGGTPNGDNAYVYTSTVGNVDTYQIGPLPYSGTVKGVQIVADIRKDNSGTRVVNLGVGNGTEEVYNTPTPYIVANDYLYDLEQYDINPITGAQWANADFTTLQTAIKLIQ